MKLRIMLRFNSSEDCSILWHSASSLRTIIASSVLNRTWVQSVNCHASVKMVIWGQVRRINEGNLLIFWLLRNLSLKFAIFLLQQTDWCLAKKADYKEAFQDGELSPSARLLTHCVLSKTQTWWLAVSRRSCCASPRSRPTFYQTWLGQWADNWYGD